MVKQFIGRISELKALNDAYDNQRSEFLVIYGRRRVGKTELLRQFLKDKKALYFLADERSESENLSVFRSLASDILGNDLLKSSDAGWVEILKEISKTKDRIIIAIDEYPFLINKNNAIPSLFQKAWDLFLKDSNIMLILCGSSISMMEQEVLGYKSPLYGRRTGQLRLQSLTFKDASLFFPKFTKEDMAKIYAITDGLPYYLNEAQFKVKNITDLNKLFSPESLLLEEAEILLSYEFREPKNYFSILRSISFGKTKFGEIVNHSNLSASIVSQYLSNLSVVRFLEIKHPITERIHNSRNARYFITDNYLLFWFRFIYPNKSMIYKGMGIYDFEKEFNCYLGNVFEKMASELLWETRPISFKRIGRWWHKEREIDIVALNDDTKDILFVECKWKNLSKKQTETIFRNLKDKSIYVDWNLGKRNDYFCVIAKKIEGKKELRKQGYVVFDLEDF